jgi:hypothetical protein
MGKEEKMAALRNILRQKGILFAEKAPDVNPQTTK